MLALYNHNSVLSQQHSARRVGEKERQQREQYVRPPFASLSSHCLSCLSSLTSPPSAPRHTPLCTTDDCPVCTVPRLPGEKERQQREQCVHSPLRLSFLSLTVSFLFLLSPLPPPAPRHTSLHMTGEPMCAPLCVLQSSSSGGLVAFSSRLFAFHFSFPSSFLFAFHFPSPVSRSYERQMGATRHAYQ